MLDFQKYNIKEKKQEKNKVTRIIIKQHQQPQNNIYMAFALKIVFFLKSNSRL